MLGLEALRNVPSPLYAPPSLPGLTDLSSSNSAAVRRAAQQYGLREGGENDDWTLYWTDYSVSLERVMEMKSYQVSGSELVLSISAASALWAPSVPQGDLVCYPMSPLFMNSGFLCRKSITSQG